MVSNIFYFHPYLGKMSNLTSIFFRWVGSTTNQKSIYFPLLFRFLLLTRVHFTTVTNQDLVLRPGIPLGRRPSFFPNQRPVREFPQQGSLVGESSRNSLNSGFGIIVICLDFCFLTIHLINDSSCFHLKNDAVSKANSKNAIILVTHGEGGYTPCIVNVYKCVTHCKFPQHIQ